MEKEGKSNRKGRRREKDKGEGGQTRVEKESHRNIPGRSRSILDKMKDLLQDIPVQIFLYAERQREPSSFRTMTPITFSQLFHNILVLLRLDRADAVHNVPRVLGT